MEPSFPDLSGLLGEVLSGRSLGPVGDLRPGQQHNQAAVRQQHLGQVECNQAAAGQLHLQVGHGTLSLSAGPKQALLHSVHGM